MTSLNKPNQPQTLPHKVSILGQQWKVIEADRKGPGLEGNDGTTDFEAKTIFVAADLGPIDKADTFLHELMHLTISAMSIQFRSDNAEERVVRPLATGLTAMFNDCPGILRAIADLIRAAHRGENKTK